MWGEETGGVGLLCGIIAHREERRREHRDGRRDGQKEPEEREQRRQTTGGEG